MKPRRLSSLARVTAGRRTGADVWVKGAAADSREVRTGDLFVAIRGQRVDGQEYVDDAFERGAAAALVTRERDGRPSLIVRDTGAALLDIAAEERSSMDAEVIGITGSTGKTSVKDLAVAVLSTRFRAAGSPRSFNTEVGVPLTLLNAPPETEIAVCEMGSRGRGHIAALCLVARPRVGVVTNVGLAHMEMFGSPDGVADAKAELVESLPADGVAVLNADDPVVRRFDRRTRARPLRFGLARDAEVRGEDLSLDKLGRPSFTLRTPSGSERVELSVSGEHMAWNALAAAACGVAVGLTPGECAAGLKEASVSAWRMEVFDGRDGIRVINDAYNANPASMAAALKAARWIAGSGRCLAVLGEMAELGSIGAREHERIGELVARLGIEPVIVVGREARLIAVGATREGVEPDQVRRCETIDEAIDAVWRATRPGDVVLVKGSRVAGLERVAEALR
jgi:UDP-N-acetylmuramoyl-tripeptide--D-alanyl-D-alanine ligase